MSRPVVVLVAHGTADLSGRAVLDGLRVAVADRLTGHDVRLAFVDVIDPTPQQVLVGTSGAVLVPLFLASGYHVSVDVAAAVDDADAAWATEALGADPLVVEAVADRVRAVVASPEAVVLAAAGSSRETARAEVEGAGRRLATLLGCPVETAFLGGPGTTMPEALAVLTGHRQSRAAGDAAASAPGDRPVPAAAALGSAHDLSSVVVAAHLLAPGHFHSRAARLAREHGLRCTEPIGFHPRIVDLVVRLAMSVTAHSHPTT